MQIYDRAKRITAGGVLTGILILGGCGQQTTTGGPPPGGPPEVAVVTIQPKRLVITTELSGRTSANLVAEVRPQVGGIIQKRLFTEGADVKAGQCSIRSIRRPSRRPWTMPRRTLLLRRRMPTGAGGAAGEPRQRDPAAGHPELARTNRERFEEAFKERAVSASQRDQVVTEAKVAEATMLAAEAQVESDRKAVAAAEAAIQQAEAALKTARINLGYTADHRAHLGPHRKIQRDGGRPGDGPPAHGPGHHSATGSHVRGCAPVHGRTSAPAAPPGGRPARPQRSRPEKGPAHAGRRHRISMGRDAAIPRRHGRSDDRIGHPADRLSQSRRAFCCRACSSGRWWRKASIQRPS